MGKCKMVSPEDPKDTQETEREHPQELPLADKAAFLGLRRIVRVDLPEMGCAVNVKVMSGLEQMQWVSAFNKAKESGIENRAVDAMAMLLMHTLCDAEGSYMFPPEGFDGPDPLDASPIHNAEDVEKLRQIPATVIMKLATIAQRVNGLTDADIEALEGN